MTETTSQPAAPASPSIDPENTFVVLDQNALPGLLYPDRASAQAAAAEVSGAALPLAFMLRWWKAAQDVCVALDVAREDWAKSGADGQAAHQRLLNTRFADWRRYMAPVEAPELPADAVAAVAAPPVPTALDTLAGDVDLYLAELKRAVVASQVKAMEVGTLRVVRREDINVASQLAAFARLLAAAALQGPNPNVVISAFATLTVQALMNIIVERERAGAGHA